MAKRSSRVTIERAKASGYKVVADSFYNGAELAKDFEYWNASGVLIVHAAIALADAITIKIGGVKCRGEDHHEVIGLINELIIPGEEKRKALNQLDRIIDHKSAVSYRGDIYQSEDIELLWKFLDRFRQWAVSVLEN